MIQTNGLPDSDGDGIPDAFQNRLTITELLFAPERPSEEEISESSVTSIITDDYQILVGNIGEEIGLVTLELTGLNATRNAARFWTPEHVEQLIRNLKTASRQAFGESG